jgi:hypothetical protein
MTCRKEVPCHNAKLGSDFRLHLWIKAMPELLLLPDVVEMITALFSVFIALIALLEMRRMRRDTLDENRKARREINIIRERLVSIESKQH